MKEILVCILVMLGVIMPNNTVNKAIINDSCDKGCITAEDKCDNSDSETYICISENGNETIELPCLEKQKKSTEVIYIEIDDIHKVNAVIDEIKNTYDIDFIFQAIPPKSSNPGCMGINLVTDRVENFDFEKLCSIEHIAYALEDQ